MKPVVTPTEARERLTNLSAQSWDTRLKPHQLDIDRGVCAIRSDGKIRTGYGITDWAKAQLLGMLSIPSAYYDKCPPILQELQFSYWRDRLDEKGASFLVRGRENSIRGVLSRRYAIIDDLYVFNALEPLFAEGASITLFEVTEKSFHMRLVAPNSLVESNLLDPLYCGVHISNSEVGYRPVSVDSVVYRQVCSNGLVRLHDRTGILRRRHIGNIGEDFPYRFLQAARSAIGLAEETAKSFIKAKYRHLPDPEGEVRSLAQKWDLSKGVQQSIIDQISAEAYPETGYALINAVTSVAQGLDPDSRLRLESLAGSLV